MSYLYSVLITVINSLARVTAPFNSKVSLWVKGLEGWEEKVKGKIKSGDQVVWMHCASLGEFEQGRPVLEEMKLKNPGLKVVLTFFSPSGYEVRKGYAGADIVSYLPPDTPRNATRFINLVNPMFVIFVKYEFWNNYISELYRKNIPLFLISAIFRPGQHFFKWYGSFFRGMLKKFKMIFVQDKASLGLLASIGMDNAMLAGDTRFDRVVQIAGAAKDIQLLEDFRGNEKLFLAGSSWKPDEEIIAEYINSFPDSMKWVFAPHEIDTANIERLEKLFNATHVRFSEFATKPSDARILIIDNIGMLSSAYRYASVAAVGGGFGKGIHNILEPACWSIPVIFGPNHTKFREAVELLEAGGAMSFKNYDEFKTILDRWLTDEKAYSDSASAAGRYVRDNTGATEIILQYIGNADINSVRS
jgi:3-deoxy-D-manno-octulosonic-acid transferase